MITEATNSYEHPVLQPDGVHLQTQSMDHLGETLRRWLWTGATGGFVLGEARTGKTTALKDLVADLRTREGTRVPSYYVSIPSRDLKTVRAVWHTLNHGVGLTVQRGMTADVLSDQLTFFLSDTAMTQHCRNVVLAVDEMQRLSPNQFNAIAELYDRLRELGIYLVVFFVGNEQECTGLISRIQGDHFAHVRGRFFTRHDRFLGLTSTLEVKRCLEQYDTLCWPDNGPTYVAYFLPEAVQRGWHLADHHELIWQVYKQYQKQYHLTSWGMQYFVSTIHALLVDFLPEYGIDQLNEDMVQEAIDLSGLIPDLVKLT